MAAIVHAQLTVMAEAGVELDPEAVRAIERLMRSRKYRAEYHQALRARRGPAVS